MNHESGPRRIGRRRIAVLIHVSLMASLLIYLLLVEVVFRSMDLSPSPGTGGSFGSLRYVFYGISVLLILFIRRFPAWLKTGPGVPEPERSNRLLQTSILTSTLCEVPAILGLVMVLLTGSHRDFHYLLFLSLVLFVFYFPRRSFWEAGGGEG
jgi:hypothetical protein